MNCKLLDTHLHLDLFFSPDNSLENYKKSDHAFIAVTNLPFVYKATEILCQKYDQAFPSLGFHPELVQKYSTQIDLFIDLIDSTNFIGEIGLDYSHHTNSNKKQQRTIFEKIIAGCDKKNKVISLHARNAETDLLDILDGASDNIFILHWFSGNFKNLEIALEREYFFSVNLSMTKSQKGREIIEKIPIQKILLETDMPLVDKTGSCAIQTLESLPEKISRIKNITLDYVLKQINTNQRRVMSLSE